METFLTKNTVHSKLTLTFKVTKSHDQCITIMNLPEYIEIVQMVDKWFIPPTTMRRT